MNYCRFYVEDKKECIDTDCDYCAMHPLYKRGYEDGATRCYEYGYTKSMERFKKWQQGDNVVSDTRYNCLYEEDA